MSLLTLRLKKNEERRIQGGHLWIYSNEIDTRHSPLQGFKAGDLALVESSQGKPIGIAYVNPHSLISARLLTENSKASIDENFFRERLQAALHMRENLFAKPYYRLVFSEGDFLPGLIVDRYHDIAVVQLNTAGMECQKTHLIEALLSLGMKTVYFRNNSSIRSLEGLSNYTELAVGEMPTTLRIEENDVPFWISLTEGQKTGWFFDHRLNRALVSSLANERRVLDVFSYVGGFGLQAAHAGAKHVTFVDSSKTAAEFIRQNADEQNARARCEVITADAFDALNQLVQSKKQFDLIIVDPPAFIKKRKDLADGKKAYWHINQLALKLLAPGGMLASASCSMHLSADLLREILHSAGRQVGKPLRITHQGHQGPDHPIHPAIAESEYIKMLVAE